jgi:phospholipid/cholesterol/gamma-HCH transport system ATP-binding protein
VDKPFIEIKDLYFSRPDHPVFTGVNMNIERGKITAIMGPSGTGKTTLLRLIGAQLKPDSGSIWMDGKNIHSLGRHDLYQLRRNMGMLFQSSALFTNLTVFDNVAFPLRELTDVPEELIRLIVLMKLEAVGLRGAHELMPSELSGGMSRRVALARAIVLDPSLIMYDEPFAGQDPIAMGVLLKLIQQLNQTLGLTTVIVSHDVHETLAIADYIYLIAEGNVVGEGTRVQVQHEQNPQVFQFINGLPDGVVPFHYPARDIREDLYDGA